MADASAKKTVKPEGAASATLTGSGEPAAAAVAAAPLPGTPPTATPAPQPMEKLPGIVKGLPENRLKLVLASAAEMGNEFAAVLPIGARFEDCLRPEFWAHTAYKLHAGDQISIHSDGMGFFGVLYVRGTGSPSAQKLANRATVAVLSYTEFAPVEHGAPDDKYKVEFKGPHLQWCVVSRKGDRSDIVKERCSTEDEARTWIRTQAA